MDRGVRLHQSVADRCARSRGVGVGRDKVPVIVVGLLGVVLLGGIVTLRLLPSSSDQGTNAAFAHDPSKHRRGPRNYQERVEGRRYVNPDLGLKVTGPDGWQVSAGQRSDVGPAYEGLVVKMEPAGDPDPQTQVRPFVSVVKRTLGPGAAPDPAAYIRQHLLGEGKTVLEEPGAAEISGRPAAKVLYEMKSGAGTIRIAQLVHIRRGEAIIVSAMAPASAFGGLQDVFKGVLASVNLDL
jgi:hypothetical protein